MNKIFYSVLALLICASVYPLFQAEAAHRTKKHQPHPAAKTAPHMEDIWYTDMGDAVAAAKKSRRPILINFTGSDWCGWCVKLDREVFSKGAFKKYAERNLILLKVDFPRRKWQTPAQKKANQALARQYRIAGYPTNVLINANGQQIGRFGYIKGGTTAFVRHLQKLQRGRR